MKKQLFWMIGAALALTSCSNDEQVAVNPGNEITFRTAVTRATETNGTILQKNGFRVTAYFINEEDQAALHINNDEFIYNEISGYVGKVPHYWDVEDNQMVGQAWYPTTIKMESSTSSESEKMFTFTYTYQVNKVINDQEDFVSANVDAKKEGSGSGIEAVFNHNLSQISIAAINNATHYTVKIKEVELGNVQSGSETSTFVINRTGSTYKDGSWDGGTWNGIETLGNYSIDLSSSIVELDTVNEEGRQYQSSLMPEGEVWMLYPQSITSWNKETIGSGAASGTYIGLLVDINHADENKTPLYPEFPDELADGSSDVTNGFAWVYIPVPSITWEAGNHYAYTLQFNNSNAGYTKNGDAIIGGTEVKFSTDVSVTGWTSNNKNVTMDGNAVEP